MGSYKVYDLERLEMDERLKWIEFFWGDSQTFMEFLNKYQNVFESRKQFYMNDVIIKSYATFQFESIDGKRTKFSNEITLRWLYIDDLVKIAPAVHYRILPNEIVLDLDFKTNRESEKIKVLKYIVSELNVLGIKPLVAHSGGKGFHIHFLLGPGKDEHFDAFMSLGYSQLKPFTNVIAEWIMERITSNLWNLEETCDIKLLIDDVCDRQVLKDVHTIRMLYSFNIKDGNVVGYKHVVKIQGVECSDNYFIWKVPKKIYQRAVEVMKQEKMIEEIKIKVLEDFITGKKTKTNRIRWIEQVLQKPEKIYDGRRRLIMYVLVPYLLNVRKIPSEKVKEILEDWVNRTPYGMSSDIRSLIKSEINSYEIRSEILPMAKEKFFNRNPDLRYILEVIK